jgi:site-specific DNA-adenine methylase
MSGYFGSKATSGLCQAIISMMPPHATYIETHLGGGAIMKRKAPSMRSIGIDLDPSAISAFECPYSVELIQGCAHEFLKAFAFTGTELVYCDPPYLLHTRTSDKRYRYRFDYRDEDHVALLGILLGLPCKVMLSGYPSDLYDSTLKGWNVIEIQVMNQAGVRTEKVWFNFAIDRYHWATYAGKNYTNRQKIRRKAANWGRMYREMPRHERMAVLAAIMDVERDQSTATVHQG